MNKLIRQSIIVCSASLAAGLFFSEPAQARSVVAATGLAVATDMSCLSLWYGTMTNNCGRVVSFDWPLVVDSSGNKTVTVDAYGATSANNVGCRAEGLNAQTTSVWYSNGGAYNYLPSFGAAVDITLTGSYVPSGGQLLVNCQMNNGSRLQVANWNA